MPAESVFAEDEPAHERERRAEVLADADGHERQVAHTDGVEQHRCRRQTPAPNSSRSRTAVSAPSPFAPLRKKRMYRIASGMRIRISMDVLTMESIRMLFFDCGVDREQQRQHDRHIRHTAEARAAARDADDHDREDHDVPPADLLLIDKRAEHEHDERLDVVGHAALEGLPALDGPEVDDPVAAHEQRRGESRGAKAPCRGRRPSAGGAFLAASAGSPRRWPPR